MKNNLLFLLLIILNLNPFSLFAQEPQHKTFSCDGFEREYLLYLPKNYENNQTYPIVVCLHGFNKSMYSFFKEYNTQSIANKLNAIILAPQALPEQDPKVIDKKDLIKDLIGVDIPLEACWGCGLRVKAELFNFIPLLDVELNKNVNDVEFIHQLIQHVGTNYPVQNNNIFFLGTSMGAYMSYQYAMHHGNELAGLIAFAGSMGLNIDPIQSYFNLPICDFQSIDDDVVPYKGYFMKSGTKLSLCKSKDETIKFWIQQNNTNLDAKIEEVNKYNGTTPYKATKYTYSGLSKRNELIHYKLFGAHHNYYFKKENGDCMDFNEEAITFMDYHLEKTNANDILSKSDLPCVFPNPAKETIFISKENAKILIYDLQGKLLIQTHSTSTNHAIDISNLTKGIYLIKIIFNNKIQTEKLIVL